ncbi:MAG: hypothetical protein DPW16_20880 [Chloroflexi bacterium]|nr:hypothetical protein [Chloroflexota bacterium]
MAKQSIWRRNKQDLDYFRSLLTATVGGAAGVAAMAAYWKTVTAITGRDPRQNKTNYAGEQPLDSISIVGKQHERGESSTGAIGRIVYRALMGRAPQSQETRTFLSYLVHWVISLGMSGISGSLQRRRNKPDAKNGLMLGSGLFLLGDELAMPLLGLADGPTAYPPKLHIHSFGAHVAYGLASSFATKILRKFI